MSKKSKEEKAASKSKKSKQAESGGSSTADHAALFESLGRKIDDLPKVQAAEKLVLRAQQQLDKAQNEYRRVRQEAAEHVRDLRETSLGDLADTTLEYVRRHPGQGVVLSALFGFLLARLFRR